MATSILERASRRIGPAGTADAARGRRLLAWHFTRWHWLGIYAVLNAPLIALALWHNFVVQPPPDWAIFATLGDRLTDGTLYAVESRFRWSPVAAVVMAGIVPLGFAAWTVLHVAALALLRDRFLVVLILVSYGFWTDVAAGNAFTFVLVAALLAWRGNRGAELVYLGLCLLMPRPVQAPLALWLLWQRPHTRMPFAAMFVVHAGAVLLLGGGSEWVARLLATAGPEAALGIPWNVAPSVLVGPLVWMAVGIPVAAWLLRRGHVGWASLAASPYWLPYYLLFALLNRSPAPMPVAEQLIQPSPSPAPARSSG